MTGEKVLRRAMHYRKDIEALRLQAALADDVAMRITRGLDGSGGRSGGHSDKPGDVALQLVEIEEAAQARERCYERELIEGARLIGEIPWLACADVMRRTCLCGDSLRQIAAAIRQSEDSVRSLRRRGWNMLSGMHSELDRDEGYARDYKAYESAARRKESGHDHP